MGVGNAWVVVPWVPWRVALTLLKSTLQVSCLLVHLCQLSRCRPFVHRTFETMANSVFC